MSSVQKRGHTLQRRVYLRAAGLLLAAVGMAAMTLPFLMSPARAQQAPPVFPPDKPGPPGSLKGVQPPLPPNLGDFVVDQHAAVVLGKALFWDQQAGGDGLACGSCHFHAGADNRIKNQLSNRVFEQIGQKLLRRQPLAGQKVDPTDSVLGPYANTPRTLPPGATGLTTRYDAVIKAAFAPDLWNSPKLTVEGYTQMEKNFSLFWGLSIMLYESTLVADDTPFDRYMSGNITAMTTQQVDGFNQVFMNKGGCIFCHSGAEFTSAPRGSGTPVRSMRGSST